MATAIAYNPEAALKQMQELSASLDGLVSKYIFRDVHAAFSIEKDLLIEIDFLNDRIKTRIEELKAEQNAG